MIILKDIYLQNFMSISELSLSFEDDCIVAITGDNGSGKSALFYAIAFAITNYRRGESYRDYVQTGSESAKILLNASLNGYPLSYDIDIYSNTKKGVIAPTKRKVTYKDKVYLNSDYNQFIKEYELDYLDSLMFLFPENNNIINVKPSERSATLRRLFKFEFDDISKIFKEKQEALKAKSIELAVKINELNSRIFEKQTLIRTLTPEGLKLKKDKLNNLNLNLSSVSNIDEKEISKYDMWLVDTNNDLTLEKNKLEKIKKEIFLKENNLLKMQKEKEDIPAIKELEDQINLLLKDKEVLLKNKQEIEKKFTEITNNLSVLSHNVSELKSQIKICETGVCHACGHHISEEHTENLKKHLKQISEEKNNEEVSKNKIKEENLKLEEKIKSISNELKRKESLINTFNTLEKDISFYKNTISSLKDNLKDKEITVERLEKDKIKIENEKKELDKLKPLLKEKKDLEIAKINLEEIIKKTENDWIRNEEKRKVNIKTEEERVERDTKVKALTEEQNNIELDIITAKACADIFDTSFPNFIILQACEQLEDFINNIISKMFPYMRVSLKLSRSGVNFFYLSETSEDEWIPVSMASVAQKRVLSLAYSIALAKMYGLNCILIDEVDANTTAANAKIIYEFIASMEDFQQVIFISHRKESLEAMVESKRENIVMYKVSGGVYEQV